MINYLCHQEVEEEIGSAEEQPISNRLSALDSKSNGDGVFAVPFFYWYRFMAKKTFSFSQFSIMVLILQNNLLSVDKMLQFPISVK